MASVWIICKSFMSKMPILKCFLVLAFTLSVLGDGPGRPMLISLPINVRASMPVGPPPFYDLAESAEEQRLDERVVRQDNESPNDFFSQDDNSFNSRTQPGFLTWNPGSKLMVLQLNDYIGARASDQDDQFENNSEEFEKTEDTRSGKQMRLPSDMLKEFPGFEDYRRLMDSRRRPDSLSKKSKASSLATESKLRYVDQSGENDGGGVYGAEPVVHFLRESRKRKNWNSNSKTFSSDHDQEESNGNFNMKDWWGNY